MANGIAIVRSKEGRGEVPQEKRTSKVIVGHGQRAVSLSMRVMCQWRDGASAWRIPRAHLVQPFGAAGSAAHMLAAALAQFGFADAGRPSVKGGLHRFCDRKTTVEIS